MTKRIICTIIILAYALINFSSCEFIKYSFFGSYFEEELKSWEPEINAPPAIDMFGTSVVVEGEEINIRDAFLDYYDIGITSAVFPDNSLICVIGNCLYACNTIRISEETENKRLVFYSLDLESMEVTEIAQLESIVDYYNIKSQYRNGVIYIHFDEHETFSYDLSTKKFERITLERFEQSVAQRYEIVEIERLEYITIASDKSNRILYLEDLIANNEKLIRIQSMVHNGTECTCFGEAEDKMIDHIYINHAFVENDRIYILFELRDPYKNSTYLFFEYDFETDKLYYFYDVFTVGGSFYGGSDCFIIYCEP